MFMMKLKSTVVAGIAAMLFSCGGAKEELKDIVKPHVGMYECTEARLGEREYLDKFDYIHLELKSDETFILHYCEKGGKKQRQEGQYRYDREKGTLTLLGGGLEREFPFVEGVLTVVIPLGGRTIHLKFEQK